MDAESRRLAGASWQSIAPVVGLSAAGLKRWSDSQSGEPGLRAVRIRRGGRGLTMSELALYLEGSRVVGQITLSPAQVAPGVLAI